MNSFITPSFPMWYIIQAGILKVAVLCINASFSYSGKGVSSWPILNNVTYGSLHFGITSMLNRYPLGRSSSTPLCDSPLKRHDRWSICWCVVSFLTIIMKSNSSRMINHLIMHLVLHVLLTKYKRSFCSVKKMNLLVVANKRWQNFLTT